MPVRWNEWMSWKYDDDRCGGGQVETEGHVLFVVIYHNLYNRCIVDLMKLCLILNLFPVM